MLFWCELHFSTSFYVAVYTGLMAKTSERKRAHGLRRISSKRALIWRNFLIIWELGRRDTMATSDGYEKICSLLSFLQSRFDRPLKNRWKMQPFVNSLRFYGRYKSCFLPMALDELFVWRLIRPCYFVFGEFVHLGSLRRPVCAVP